ncbi:M16 family metallopeptidase [Streptomyces sp. R28]|uniref:M16 family metallopeptidase n=1 Tax=Streptomyces sp. R28 TaxID=3238628 RepID=A0AB39Q274_9ACTN
MTPVTPLRELPALEPGRAFPLPPLVDTVLPGGLRVVAARAPSVPMVELRMRVPLPEAAEGPAVAQVLADTLFADAEGADDLLGRAGATLGAGVDGGRLSVSASMTAAAFPEVLDLVARALAGAAHPDPACEHAVRRLTAQLGPLRAQPRVLAQDALRRHCYGPDVPSLLPDEQALAAVTAERVRRLHDQGMHSRGAFLVLVGDLDPSAAADHAAIALSAWPGRRWQGGPGTAAPPPPQQSPSPLPQQSPSPLPQPSPPPPPRRMRPAGVAVVDRPGAVQSQIMLVAPGLPRADPGFAALSLANCVLGGFFSSRLTVAVREERGLAYRIDAVLDELLDEELVFLDADTRTGATEAAVRQMRAELLRLAEQPPSGAETDAAREFFTGMTALGAASQAGLAGALVNLLQYGLSPDWLRTFPQRLAEVTLGEVARAAQEFYAPSRFSGVIVGDRSGLASQDFDLFARRQ